MCGWCDEDDEEEEEEERWRFTSPVDSTGRPALGFLWDRGRTCSRLFFNQNLSLRSETCRVNIGTTNFFWGFVATQLSILLSVWGLAISPVALSPTSYYFTTPPCLLGLQTQ